MTHYADFSRRNSAAGPLEIKCSFHPPINPPLSFCLSVLEKRHFMIRDNKRDAGSNAERQESHCLKYIQQHNTLIPEKQKAGRAIWDEIKHQ